jgi:hypothetical protein
MRRLLQATTALPIGRERMTDHYVIRNEDDREDIRILSGNFNLPTGFKVMLKTADEQEAAAARTILRLATNLDSLERTVRGEP